MMRVLILGVAFSAAIAGAAFAADEDVMAGFYGNTTVATGGMAETHTAYSADHSFVMKVPSFGVEFKGKWAINNGQLCRTFDSPPPGVTNPLCTPIAAHKVGDTWTMGDRTVTLIKGVQ